MKKFDVQIALEDIREKRKMWKDCHNTFKFNVNKVMRRLMHEAAACYMSVEEVAKASGLKHSQVRQEMRRAGLNPAGGKTLLAKTAAEALATNSELLGIAPHEMDLMSPLAYLPMGSELRQQITDKSVSQVTELEEFPETERTKLEGRLYEVIVYEYEGMGEAWTTDESGDTLARAAAQVAAREILSAGWHHDKMSADSQ